jgi:hypothetical protein
MGLLEGLPVSLAVSVVYVLGLPGLVMILWYVDHRRTDKILSVYKRDMTQVTRFYENNVDLVKHYENLANDLASIIHLNTQVQTQLVEQIKNNMFCPMVRQKGPGA